MNRRSYHPPVRPTCGPKGGMSEPDHSRSRALSAAARDGSGDGGAAPLPPGRTASRHCWSAAAKTVPGVSGSWLTPRSYPVTRVRRKTSRSRIIEASAGMADETRRWLMTGTLALAGAAGGGVAGYMLAPDITGVVASLAVAGFGLGGALGTLFGGGWRAPRDGGSAGGRRRARRTRRAAAPPTTARRAWTGSRARRSRAARASSRGASTTPRARALPSAALRRGAGRAGAGTRPPVPRAESRRRRGLAARARSSPRGYCPNE